MKRLNQKGFTLVEVIAVVVIIAVLGVIAVPSVLNTIENGKKGSYNVVIENIKTAAINLYEEIDLVGNNIPLYQGDGSQKLDEAGNALLVTIDTNKQIVVNLQTLLSNGFLKGTSLEESDLESHKKMFLQNPMTNEDMGECEILIQKVVNNNFKISYVISSITDREMDFCPTSEEYKNGVK